MHHEFTWALESLEPEHEYMRFAGSVLEEYLYRSPKRVAEMINERMASPPSGCSASRTAAIPTPGIL